ncbi:DUF6973 domain-containing protein [Nocardioides piscis]|uniref:DUF6973 domain-containing protein n=1 Tax=Nocardioides piscis TaxID=2714938 RepID=A0A6G7YJZ0_9ACTN|nr:hypothetical protein [Nocardioides piscis]QIK77050.1 hypothetical protein G7071_18015 [Nocardioides piscis]
MPSPFESLPASLKKVAQAVVGAPNVFHAARDAGASASAAADVMAASAAAVQIASSATDGTPGLQNAVRHFIWQAYIAGRHGVAVAQAVADAHEAGRDTPHDTRIDQHNNEVGRAYGAANSATIGRGSITDALQALVPVAKEKWASDELIWVKPR